MGPPKAKSPSNEPAAMRQMSVCPRIAAMNVYAGWPTHNGIEAGDRGAVDKVKTLFPISRRRGGWRSKRRLVVLACHSYPCIGEGSPMGGVNVSLIPR